MKHDHLTLRPWRLSDAAALPGLIGDPAVQRNLRDGLPFPYTEADARTFLTAMLAADPEETFPFAIAWDDVAIGSLSLLRAGEPHRGRQRGLLPGPGLLGPGNHDLGGGGSLPVGLCPHGPAADLCHALCPKPPLLPGAGEGWVPAGGHSPTERGEGRGSAGYEALCPPAGRPPIGGSPGPRWYGACRPCLLDRRRLAPATWSPAPIRGGDPGFL